MKRQLTDKHIEELKHVLLDNKEDVITPLTTWINDLLEQSHKADIFEEHIAKMNLIPQEPWQTFPETIDYRTGVSSVAAKINNDVEPLDAF